MADLIAASTPDFSVTASPSSASTSPGGSVSHSIAVGSTNGFTGSVGLTVAGLPTGATASFAPATVTAPGSSQLTIATDASIAPGTYSLTVSGTSSSTTRTTAIALTVNPPTAPDFALTATPGSRTVVRGASTSYTIVITPAGGFTGSVTFSATGLPGGTSASFTPNPATDSSTLSISTASSAKPGGYTLTVSGTNGDLVHSTTVSLQLKRK